MNDLQVNLWTLFTRQPKTINETSLTMLYNERQLRPDEKMQLQAMDLRTARFFFE
jgi:hypothetical protein